MITIYQIKPRFQNLLRPITRRLAAWGVTANQVTLFAMIISLAVGVLIATSSDRRWFVLIPFWCFLRMALNAIDGMLAREWHQKSALGGYFNELSDVIADAGMYLPFALVVPFSLPGIAAVVWVATLSEMAGAIGPLVGATRRYDGPMGKSDRAFVFGVLGLWYATGAPLPAWFCWLPLVLVLLMCLNIFHRVRNGVRETRIDSN